MSFFSFLIIVTFSFLKANAYVDEPLGCLQAEKLPCAVRATFAGEKFHYKKREVQANWLAAKKASWVLDEQGFKFISGQVWLQSSVQFSVRTNSVVTLANSELWLESVEERTKIANLSGDSLNLKLAATGEKQSLPVGFENWFSGLDSAGQVSHGVPKAVDKVQFFKDWAQKLRVSDSFAKEKIAEWKEQWKNIASLSSEIYSGAVKRAIAQQEQKELKEIQARERKREEQRKLRKMFRARNGLENDSNCCTP